MVAEHPRAGPLRLLKKALQRGPELCSGAAVAVGPAGQGLVPAGGAQDLKNLRPRYAG